MGGAVSVQASSWVWKYSQSAGNARLLLLAIADAADQHGENAWPSQPTLAEMVRVSVRTVRRLVAELVELGELEVEEFAGGTTRMRPDRRPHLYRLPKMAGPDGRSPVSARQREGVSTGGHPTFTGGHPGGNGRTLLSAYPSSFNPSSRTKDASGGSVPDPTPIEDAQEEPMRRKPSTADQPLPLDLGDPPAKKPPAPSAGTVVAAYVDSYRRHHSGGDPLKRDIGRVAREAKELLTTGRADPGELERAAAAMGAGPWANLGQQLNIQRQQASKPANRGIAPPAPRGSFKAASDAQKAQFHEKIRTNPATAAWVAEDPDAVARVIAEDPTLAPVFAQLGAA